MKVMLLGLLVLCACSKPGPSSEKVQEMAVPLFFMPMENFKVSEFKVISNEEMEPGLADLNLDKVRFIVSMSGEVLNECRYIMTSIDELTSGTSGIVPGNSGSSFTQQIHHCLTKADEEKKVQEFRLGWKGKLGKADYSSCRVIGPACSGDVVTEEMIEAKVSEYKTLYAQQLSTLKVLKVGEKIDIKPHYVVLQKPTKSENDKWALSAVGESTK